MGGLGGGILCYYFREDVIWKSRAEPNSAWLPCAGTGACKEQGSAGADRSLAVTLGIGRHTKPNAQRTSLHFICLFVRQLPSSMLFTSNKCRSCRYLAKQGITFYQLSGTSVNSCERTWRLIPLGTANTLKIFQEWQEHPSVAMASAKQPE